MSVTFYGLVHFLHVVGALGFGAAFSVEAMGLVGLRRANLGSEARLWLRTRRWVLLLGPASIGTVLLSGIYMTAVRWGTAGWILVALASVVAIAMTGGLLTGIPMARLAPAVEQAEGPVAEALRHRVRDPILTVSITTRIATTLGITFLMVQQPGLVTAVVVIVLAAGIGGFAGLLLGRRGSSPDAIGGDAARSRGTESL